MDEQSTSPPSVAVSDVDTMEASIPGLDLHIQRLTAQDGPVTMGGAPLGDVDLFSGEMRFPIVTTGGVSGEHLVVGLQLEEGSGEWDGREFSARRAWFYGPGSDHFGVGRAPAAPRFVTITLGRDAVGRRLDDIHARWVVEDDLVHVLRSTVVDLLATERGMTLPAPARGHARRELIDNVAALIDFGDEAPEDQASMRRITESCIDLAAEIGPIPSSAELATAIGVTDRWIRAAFSGVYGVSPSTYFRSRALDGARRDLIAAVPGTVTVTDVATRWGFWHLGRFSGLYGSYFGEHPKTTLGRDA